MIPSAEIVVCPTEVAWSSFYGGETPRSDHARLINHLLQCCHCQTMLNTIESSAEDHMDPLIGELRCLFSNTFADEPDCRKAMERVGSLVSAGESRTNVAPVAVPSKIGEYRLIELIGRGGMGAVYRAVHNRLGREVALKIVPPHRAQNAAALSRFHREMTALGKVDHPNVVRATDAGQIDGVAYLVMDLVEGLDLARLVKKRGPLKVSDACEIATRAAAGLQHLTESGLVHRDVKPSNVMLNRRGEVKILDLGLAAVEGNDGLTGAEQILGTIDYRAPEQAEPGSPIDSRADVYGLGCTLYFLLTSVPPYALPGHSHPTQTVAPPFPDISQVRPDAPESLSGVLKRMLAKRPSDRFATPADAAAALARFCTGSNLGQLLESPELDLEMPAARIRPVRTNGRATRMIAAAAIVALLLLGTGLTAAIKYWRQPAAELDVNATGTQPERGHVGQNQATVYPVALLGFEERGVKDLGAKVVDLLFAKLAAKPEFYLVDRTDMKKVLDEQQLSLTGSVKADEAVKVGQLTGARILVTGSVVQVEKKLYLIAKVIGTETGRVVGASVEGVPSDDLGMLAGKLADAVEAAVSKNGEKLVPKAVAAVDRIAELSKKVGKGVKPVLWIQVSERHIGQPAVDPAAQTELSRFAKETGFELVDAEEGGKSKADVYVTGEGFSEVAGRVGGMVSVRARVELKAVDRKTGKVLAVDRQTVVLVDLSEQVGGKTALQSAAADLAERMLPKLVSKEKK